MILATTRSTTEVLLWAAGLIVLVIGTGLIILALRRAMLSRSAPGVDAGLFDSLREMKNTGAISQDEYDAARKNLAARAAGKAGPSGTTPFGGAPAAAAKPSGELRARPGFDLTGRPLPKSDKPPGCAE